MLTIYWVVTIGISAKNIITKTIMKSQNNSLKSKNIKNNKKKKTVSDNRNYAIVYNYNISSIH